MDKSSDSSSDSDSNSSTSWVFVQDATIPCPNPANTFHLDCSREPIQELTEQDLLSAGSDFESDTDGISVISESEVPIDEPCLNIQTLNDSLTDVVDDEVNTVHKDSDETAGKDSLLVKEQHEKLTKIIKPLHMLGIGFVVTAVFLACYSRITTKISKENVDFDSVNDDVPLYDKIKVDDVMSYNKIDLPACDVSNKLHDAKTDLNKDLEEIVDITMTCAFLHKPKTDVLDKQIKKCVKKEYNTKKTRNSKNPENIYNEKLESMEHYKKVIEIKSENILNNINKPKIKPIDDDFEVHIRRKFSKEQKEKARYKKNDETVCNIESENQASYKKRETVGAKAEFAKIRDSGNVVKLKRPNKKQNSQEQFKSDHKRNAHFEHHEHVSKKQSPSKKPYNKIEKDKKHEYKDKQEYYDYKNKKSKYVDTKKYEYKQNYNRNFNKHQKNTEDIIKHKKENKFKEVPNKNVKSKESKYRDKITLQKRNNTTTGEWYTNLHKARNQLRKQEHVSDWVFDRAHLRNKKRNKAQWYFKWMNIREQLRYKQSYKPYSS